MDEIGNYHALPDEKSLAVLWVLSLLNSRSTCNRKSPVAFCQTSGNITLFNIEVICFMKSKLNHGGSVDRQTHSVSL
jgi:hypothetical protein